MATPQLESPVFSALQLPRTTFSTPISPPHTSTPPSSPTPSSATPSSHTPSHPTAPSSPSSRWSVLSVDSSDSLDSLELDEGEGEWDALGRMSSVRRSTRFDRPHFVSLTLSRGDSGYGLQLYSSAPPIVGQVFGVAKEEGVRPGDRLLEVNGECVRGCNHAQAGRLIAGCPETVSLLLHTHKPLSIPRGRTVHSGWLSKRGGTGLTPRNWRRRWFVLRDDCIAYYFTDPEDQEALGAIVLRNYTVSKANRDVKKKNAFKLVKGGSRSYYLSADTEADMNKWAQVFTEAATLEGRESVHFSGTAHNVSLSPLSIRDPDCHGFLHKQGQNVRSWKKRYCVLRRHQLFYYGQMHHTTAYGVMNLLNYSLSCGKSKEKKFYFEAHPPEQKMRTYHLYCESATERERWMTAIENGIGSTESS